MKRITLYAMAALLGAACFAAQQPGAWQTVFPVDKKALGPTGANSYFMLTPGYRLTLQHGDDLDVVTVLNETKMVDGVEVRAVEDRETKKGQLVELTRDYYAIDPVTKDVYYMGEDVDVYKNGKVVSHEGAWLSGVKGAKFGLMMPGQPKPGQRFYQEQAPGLAMDRAAVVSLNERVVTPAGTFNNCVHVHETSAIEKTASDDKWYAPGVGLVKDGQMLLVKYGKN